MTDDLEPIRQPFIADMAEYIEPMQEAQDEAKRFARENQEASEEVRELARAVRENSDEIRRLATVLAEDNHELDRTRDASMEAGAALGHLRDEAAEAAHEVNSLGRQAEETSAALDLMGLSGLSTGMTLFKMIGIIGTLIGVAAAIAPAFVAAGLGLGAFALFALPALKQAKGEVTAFKNELASLSSRPDSSPRPWATSSSCSRI
jgi:hypothetical protein